MIAEPKAYDMGELLKSGYDPPPPDESFVARLGDRLKKELAQAMGSGRRAVMGPRRRLGWPVVSRRWAIAAVLITASVLGFGLLVVGLKEPGTKRGPMTAAVRRRWARIDTRPLLIGGPGRSLREPPLSVQIARASVIARCTVVELTETHLVYKVRKLIYGRLPGRTLRVVEPVSADVAREILKSKLDREPTDEEVRTEQARLARFEAGRDSTEFVVQMRTTDGALEWRGIGGTPGDDGALEEMEKEIVEVIRAGAHLTPTLSAEDLAEYLRASELVVRARLTKIGETTSTWKVGSVLYVGTTWPGAPLDEQVLKGKLAEESARPTGTEIQVGLDAWWLRAEAIVNYEATQDPKKAAAEEDIQKEFNLMVRAELEVGREAVLFLRSGAEPEKGSTYKLVGILHDDPEKAERINEIENAIRDMIEKGLHRTHYL